MINSIYKIKNMYIANNNNLNSVYILHEDKKKYIWPQVN